MEICVLGLGYVGLVTACCLALDGHTVKGVDITHTKILQINQGKSPFFEPGLEELLSSLVKSNRLEAYSSLTSELCNAEVFLICVGTPANKDGSTNISYISDVCKEIAQIFKSNNTLNGGFKSIIIRSTVPPGASENRLIPMIEEIIGRAHMDGWGLFLNPEFLREGSAIHDYKNPSKIVFGGSNYTDEVKNKLKEIYSKSIIDFDFVSHKSAECTKLMDNTWHALKVCFANEMGSICDTFEVNKEELFHLFHKDKQLNISSKYLNPGFAFGGSCLPKDTRSLTFLAMKTGKLPLIESIFESNQKHTWRIIEKIATYNFKSFLILGITFKPKTDDLRESPYVLLVEHFIGKGKKPYICDINLLSNKIHGTNKDYAIQHVSHFSEFLVNDLNKAKDIAKNVDVVLVGSACEQYDELISCIDKEKLISIV